MTARNWGLTGSRLQLRGKDTAADSHGAATQLGANIIPFRTLPLPLAPNARQPTGGSHRPFYSDEPAARHWAWQLAIDVLSIVFEILFIVVSAASLPIAIFMMFLGSF